MNEKEDENQEKEVVQQQKVLEQINMLDDMKEKAQNWAMLKALRAGKNQGLSGKAIRQDYNRVSKKVSVKALLNKNLLLMNGKAY